MPTPFKIDSIFQSEAQEIINEHSKAKVLHASADIKAAGNQVEIAVRQSIAGRMPSQCRVVHGHILDVLGNTSPQCDVIISENLYSKPIFRAEDGTEYVPYESVYAIGEIKSTYVKAKRYIEEFSDKLRAIDEALKLPVPCMNELFSFILFVDGSGFDVNDITQFFIDTPLKHLPSLICFLNDGVVYYASFSRGADGRARSRVYHLIPYRAPTLPDAENHWTLYVGKDGPNPARSLIQLHVMLLQHIRTTQLQPPDLWMYLVHQFQSGSGVIFA